jgi:hypothetical protein
MSSGWITNSFGGTAGACCSQETLPSFFEQNESYKHLCLFSISSLVFSGTPPRQWVRRFRQAASKEAT